MNIIKYQYAFTLLEVLISITLSSLVLGSLFVLQSNSSKLAFKANNQIDKNLALQAALNTALLTRDSNAFFAETLKETHYKISNISALQKPPNQAKRLNWQLEKFDIVDEQNNILISSIRFKKRIQ